MYLRGLSNKNTYVIVKNEESGKKYAVLLLKNKYITIYDLDIYKKKFKMSKLNMYGNYPITSKGSVHSIIAKQYLLENYSENNFSVDHINRKPLDNRLENLRLANHSQQSINKYVRQNRISVVEGMPEEINELPRFIRWDNIEFKFTFYDHPCVDFAKEKNISVNCSGTKSSIATMSEKLYDCLQKLVDFLPTIKGLGYKYEPIDFEEKRILVGNEYNEIVRLVHITFPNYFPDGPYIPTEKLRNYFDDENYYLDVMNRLNIRNIVYYGPRNIRSDLVEIQEDEVCIMKKADKYFVWDIQYNSILSKLTIDPSDHRVYMYPHVYDILGIDASTFTKKKIYIDQIVYHIIKGNEWKDDYTIVMKNQIITDLRVKNLSYVRGQSTNFKFTTHFPIFGNDVDFGMKYLPRGVTTSLQRKDILDVYEYHVRGPSSFLRYDDTAPPSYKENVPKRFSVRKENAKDIFENKVVPFLRSYNEHFDRDNTEYQMLIDEYYKIVKKAKELFAESSL